jgi:polar amino acid transport system substrate-binding protein
LRTVLACVCFPLLVGCNLPYDPEGTLARAQGGTVRVGVYIREPWTRLRDGQPSGLEATLLREFAGELGSTIEWTVGSESELLAALERRELDVVIGGLIDDTPWRQRVGLTGPYLTSELIVGVPADEPLLRDIRRREVGVPKGRPAVAAVVRERKAIPVRVDGLANHQGPVAAGRWELHTWGFSPTDIRLQRDKHVMAVPPGENGWLVRLERFLYASEQRIQEVLRAEAEQ